MREAAITGIVDRRSGGSTAQNRAILVEGKPSFDCAKAHSETAQAICGSANLIQLDLQLAKLFWAKMAKLKGSSAEEEKRRQYDWGVARNQCGADAACVEQSYQRRIAGLGGQVPVAAVQPSQASPPPVQQVVEQKPQPEAQVRPKGPIATVQQLPNPIRLIGQADQPCDVASATLARLRKTLSVSVPDGLTVQAEELRSFVWKTSGAPPPGPASLVLAADGPVRVQGTGFYALTPEAKAPFRIKQFLQQTRVIIPLHVKGAPQSGEVKIRPLIAGPLKVSAAIIGYTQCGENPDPAPIAFDLTVEPGAPEIVVADHFDLAKPDQIIASPDGTRRLEIFGPRFHLIDVATGALLADKVGKEPRFSPTGRFVVVTVKKNFTIIDSIDGNITRARVGSGWRGDADIAWDDRDSFLISHDDYGEGEADGYILDPLTESADEKNLTNDESNMLSACSTYDDYKVKIDLENNIANCGTPSSLTVHIPGKMLREADDKDLLSSGLVVSHTAPTRWEMIDGLKFTRLFSFEAEDKNFVASTKPFIMQSIFVAKSNEQALPSYSEPMQAATRGLRNLNLPEAELALRREQRLRDFGIEANPCAPLVKLDHSAVFKKIDGSPKRFQFREDKNIRFVDIYIDRNLNKTVEDGYCGNIKVIPSRGVDSFFATENDPSVGQIQAEVFQLTLFSSLCDVGDGISTLTASLYDNRRPSQLLDFRDLVDTDIGLSTRCDDQLTCEFSAELSLNRYLIIWPRGYSTAAIVDADERKLISVLDGLPSPDVTERMSLSRDLKTLLKLDKDGGFQVIALRPAQKDAEGHLTRDSTKVNVLLSGRVVDDEVVVWTPSGQFDSTLEGASHVALRFPGRSGEYTLDQFHKLFHENDLLKRALAGEAFKPPAVKTFPPSIAVKPAFAADSIAAKIEILGGDPVDEIRIYQDGLMTNVIPVARSAKAVDVNAKRLPGARWAAFLARGPSGLFAQPVTFDAGLFPGARRRVHIVSVGIDHYDDDRIQQLHFAGSDAARFLKTLQDKAGTSVEIVSQTLLRDADASRDAILVKLNETIAKAEPGDSILLFIAGHGVQDTATKTYYLATSATRVDNIENTSLRWSDLSNALAKARSRIAVFLDTCNSGAAGTDFFATNDASVSALIDRAPSGILIFSASKGRESSEEFRRSRRRHLHLGGHRRAFGPEDGSQPQWRHRSLRTLRQRQARRRRSHGRPPNPLVRPQRHGRRFRPILTWRAENPLKMRRNMSRREIDEALHRRETVFLSRQFDRLFN